VFARDAQGAVRLLRQALDAGITFFDTADMYSQGESETLLGKAFRGRREQVILASKGGYCLPSQRKFVAKIKPFIRPLIKAFGIRREHLPTSIAGTLSQDFSPRYLVQALEASLRRLNTDYLDIYQLHSPPPSVLQSGEFVEVLEKLKQQGKIRYYGVAVDTAHEAALGLQYPQIASLQLPFGLLDQEACDLVLSPAKARGVGVIARGCFGGGLLKESISQMEVEAITPKWPQIQAYRQLAATYGRPLLEMALQFCLCTQGVSITLLGMRTEEHLRDNLRHYAALPLSEEEYRQLRGILRNYQK